MREPFWERVRIRICRLIGHRLDLRTELLDGSRWCKRCGRTVR